MMRTELGLKELGQMIKDLPQGKFVVLTKVEAGGSLEARRLSSGLITFYWRHTAEGRTERLPIGTHDPLAPPKSLKPSPRGYSIQAALESARELAKRDEEVPGGIRAERERERQREAAEKAAREKREAFTLKALCADYCTLLEARGRVSWREARNIFSAHLERPHPDLVARPAADIAKSDVMAVIRALTEAGKSTTARKLRAYLKAAYVCALTADSDPSIPSRFVKYEVTANPVDGVAALRNKSAKNPITLEELRTYWRYLKTMDGAKGAILRLHVLTGGQRLAQLARLTRDDCDAQTIVQLDRKGRRQEPREHLLPITKAIRSELQHLPKSGFVLSSDGGTTKLHDTTFSKWAKSAGTDAGIPNFNAKRVRSAIETIMASARISKDLRGQVQSHGIGGVQDRHYDGHDYLDQKREALDALARLLEAGPGQKSRTR